MTELRRHYGGAVRFPVGPLWFYLFSDPDLVQEVLVGKADEFNLGRMHRAMTSIAGDGLFSSTGDLHRRQRRIVQPAFHRSAIRTYVAQIEQRTTEMLDRWEGVERVELVEEMTLLTLDVVTDTILGGDRLEDAGAMYDRMAVGVDRLERMLTPLGPLLTRLPTRSNRAFDAAIAELRASVEALIARRRDQGREGEDALWALLAATDEEGAPLPDELIRDELITLVLAGQETTAIALCWTLWLVAQHPEADERLAEEAQEVPSAESLGGDALERLPWARQCLEEGMRLYPPAWVVSRAAARDTSVGGWDVSRGGNVFTSPWVTHRDPEIWPEPERFDPERFSPDAVEARHRFAYFPFGGGGRKCVGASLAMVEGTVALAMIARRVRLGVGEGPSPSPNPQLTLRPSGPVWMAVEPRIA